MTPPLWLVIIGLEFPALIAMMDCVQRPADHFEGGAEDRIAWIRWLVVAILLVPVLMGYGILLGYYYVVIPRNASGSPRWRLDPVRAGGGRGCEAESPTCPIRPPSRCTSRRRSSGSGRCSPTSRRTRRGPAT